MTVDDIIERCEVERCEHHRRIAEEDDELWYAVSYKDVHLCNISREGRGYHGRWIASRKYFDLMDDAIEYGVVVAVEKIMDDALVIRETLERLGLSID